jgi:hypothetical protein
MQIVIAGAAAAAIAWPAGAAAGCGDDLPAASRVQLEQRGTALAFAPAPVPLAIGRHFSLDVVVCAAEGAPPRALARVDAEMPVHRHGMNYRPTIRLLGGGRYGVDGLMFHMPGRWRFVFELGSGADLVRLVHEVDVE